MISDRSAPVDTMGCHKCSDLDSPENVQRYQHLIALMLSSQTKDGVTYDVKLSSIIVLYSFYSYDFIAIILFVF